MPPFVGRLVVAVVDDVMIVVVVVGPTLCRDRNFWHVPSWSLWVVIDLIAPIVVVVVGGGGDGDLGHHCCLP